MVEYRLNRIDTERRQEINNASKEGIIHGYKNISIYKNKESKKESEKKPQKYKLTKLSVDATKAEELEIDAYNEETHINKNNIGTFLDVKR